MVKLPDIISEYWSDDGLLKAEVIKDHKFMYVKFYEGDKLVSAESYEGHSIEYYENAAENYVLRIKHV